MVRPTRTTGESMEIPDVHLMDKVAWQIFGTLTFKSERLSFARRQRMWFAEVRTLSRWHHVHFSKLDWVLRIEQGEATGRTHFHCLIGGLPKTAVSGGVRFQREDGSWDVGNRTTHSLEAKWARMGLDPADKQNRISRFSLYDARLNGASYLVKCLGVENSRLGKDIYESAKFAWEDRQLILSDSLLPFLSSQTGLSACSGRTKWAAGQV